MSESKNEDKNVHTERIFVTAEMARRWLRSNVNNNRPLHPGRVQEYMRDMKTGNWKENGSTIVFADTGELIDGQHRLQACMEGGVGFWSLVAYGVNKDAFITIDRGQSRSNGQMLHLSNGICDYNAVAATLSYLYRFRDGIMLSHGRPTSVETDALLKANPGIQASVSAARRVIHNFKAGPVAVIAVCHYLFTRQDATLAETFFDALANGASLREIDPVFQLRARLISASTSPSKKISSYELLALMFKAWLAEKEQRTMKQALRWTQAESFPNIGPIEHINPVKKELANPNKSTAGIRRRQTKPIPKEEAQPKIKPQTKLDALIEKHKSLDERRTGQ